jgi:hypothetical protein
MTIQSLLGMIPLHYKHIKTSKDKYCGKYCLKILSNTDEGFGIGCRQTVTMMFYSTNKKKAGRNVLLYQKTTKQNSPTKSSNSIPPQSNIYKLKCQQSCIPYYSIFMPNYTELKHSLSCPKR